MKKWYIAFTGLILMFGLVLYTSFFVSQPKKEVNSFSLEKEEASASFGKEKVSLQVIPNYDERALNLVLMEGEERSEGKLGGEFFDQFIELTERMNKLDLIATPDGRLNVKWDWIDTEKVDVDVKTDVSIEFDAFLEDVVKVMNEDIY